MLVLSRQRDETIMIGDDIEITVVDIRGDKVRLGINAPTRIAVHRKEVYEAIKAENLRAAALAQGDLAALKAAMPRPIRRPGDRPPALQPTGGHKAAVAPAPNDAMPAVAPPPGGSAVPGPHAVTRPLRGEVAS